MHVVGDVVVEPGEQRPSLVEGGRERLGQGECEAAEGGDAGPVELGQTSVVVGAREVIADETWQR